MRFAGIIAEYDPFHNGHAAQLAALKAAGAEQIAVAMSTGAVQRGGLPILPEGPRVAAALDSGADIVIALPPPYACATAEQFAAAGVRLLAALGCDTLAFGAETPDAAPLLAVAELLQSGRAEDALRANLTTGMTYAAARAAAAEEALPGAAALLQSPNNILGVEYCKAILAQQANLTPYPLPRFGAAHGDGATGLYKGTPIASASTVRGLPLQDWLAFVPPQAYSGYCIAAAEGLLLDKTKFDTAILALLRSKTVEDFAQTRGVSEGLEHRLAAALRTATSVEELYTTLKTKRYPHARLRRFVLDAALGIPGNLPPVPYLQVLGAKKAVLTLLKNASLPASVSLAELAKTGEDAALIGSLHSKMVDFSALCRVKTGPLGLAFTTKAMIV